MACERRADCVVKVWSGAVDAALIDGVAGGALAFERLGAFFDVCICQREAKIKDFGHSSTRAGFCDFHAICEFAAELLCHRHVFCVIVAVMAATTAKHDA